jgi:hypothetical protein
VEKVAVVIENHYEEVEDANISSSPDNPQRAMPYFIEDGSTPDWSENFSSLKLSKVVVPSVSSIMEPNLSNSQMRKEDIIKVLTMTRIDPDSVSQQQTHITESRGRLPDGRDRDPFCCRSVSLETL